MIEIPKTLNRFVSTAAKTATKNVRFEAITDEELTPIIEIERRRSPSRRMPAPEKQQIERRVSSDRRRSSFSSKA
jgi:hypothetical protein